MQQGRGNYIAGRWVRPDDVSSTIVSVNPATRGEAVAEVPVCVDHAGAAVTAAAEAGAEWADLSHADRVAALRRLGRELGPRSEVLARTISQEMGKPIREARAETRSLVQRIELVIEDQLPRVASWGAPGVDGECRYHPLGVVAVIGPFNYPLHLLHAHVIPALATGNSVVLKPSERTPLAAERYVEAFAASGLPPVVQLVQGGGEVGRALLEAPELRGVAFTGSWPTGHAIQRALLDRPEVLAALEMGGQNMAIVLDDADLDQALEGVLLGAYLSAGQRCTCTSRVLVHRAVADAFIARLAASAAALTVGDPFSEDAFMGPMAAEADRDRVLSLCHAGVKAGAEVLLAGEVRDGGAWLGPSLHLIAPDHDSPYTRHEVFGPDLAVTIVDDLDQALDVVNASPFGLSLALFSARRAAFEATYRRTRVGCLNWNRSTNRATSAFPFGGVGRSGNHRPAGADAVRYTTYPVQVQWQEAGQLDGEPHVRRALASSDPVASLEARHVIEEACDPYALYPTFEAGSVLLPTGQLGDDALIEPLLTALVAAGAQARRAGAVLRWELPPGTPAARTCARALADAIDSIRHLHPARFLSRRAPGAHVPATETLPRSRALLDRLIAGDFMPDDKKPPVLDLFRSTGAYFASVDDEPLIFFDSSSQIASHAQGLNPPSGLEALWTGRFGASPMSNPAATRELPTEHLQLASVLRRSAGPGLRHVGLCNSGAEANELAIRVAARQRPGRRALIAFEGSFHGRTLLALHATWNPAKRLRFEFEGHQARWVAWPEMAADLPEPECPTSDLARWAERGPGSGRELPPGSDPLFALEHAALCAVEEALRDDQVAAILTEPMQSEGGDRRCSGRFLACLCALAKAWDVPLIMDEVQTGFHLGGPFFWHHRWDLPIEPDIISCAKKCQVGAIVSRWPIELANETQATSALRGVLHAEVLASADATAFETRELALLAELQRAHPETVHNPRATGYAFGFDLRGPEDVPRIIQQRFWRGLLLYQAGDRTLRFRSNPLWGMEGLEALFARLDLALTSMERDEPTTWRAEALPDEAPPWPPRRAGVPSGYRLERVEAASWSGLQRSIAALQAACYEPARRDDLDLFGALLAEPGAQCFMIVKGQGSVPKAQLVGLTCAFPIEHFGHLDGPKQDPFLGQGNTLYSADVTVHPKHRGLGLGLVLKQAQLATAMTARRPDGGPRYEFLVSRNRVGSTDTMRAINARFGAWEATRYRGQYGDPDGEAAYTRLPLRAPRLPMELLQQPTMSRRTIPLRDGLERRIDPRRPGGETLAEGFLAGRMNGAIVNKVSLCNFATPSTVRALEMLRALAPGGLRHVVLASGRAEACDKGLRALKYHRGDASKVISLGPIYAGDTSAAARSASLPAGHPENWFGWPSTVDPCDDPERALEELRGYLRELEPRNVLAVVCEPVLARTGRAVPHDLWVPLREACDQAGVPLVAIENTTAAYRSGRGMWRSDSLPVRFDAVWWFPGGQLGMAFLSDDWYVPEGLVLISTWDGDELSLLRLTWELRAARSLPIAATSAALRAQLERLGPVTGEGLYLAVRTPQAGRLLRDMAARDIFFEQTAQGALLCAPPLNLTQDDIAVLAAAIDALEAPRGGA